MIACHSIGPARVAQLLRQGRKMMPRGAHTRFAFGAIACLAVAGCSGGGNFADLTAQRPLASPSRTAARGAPPSCPPPPTSKFPAAPAPGSAQEQAEVRELLALKGGAATRSRRSAAGTPAPAPGGTRSHAASWRSTTPPHRRRLECTPCSASPSTTRSSRRGGEVWVQAPQPPTGERRPCVAGRAPADYGYPSEHAAVAAASSKVLAASSAGNFGPRRCGGKAHAVPPEGACQLPQRLRRRVRGRGRGRPPRLGARGLRWLRRRLERPDPRRPGHVVQLRESARCAAFAGLGQRPRVVRAVRPAPTPPPPAFGSPEFIASLRERSVISRIPERRSKSRLRSSGPAGPARPRRPASGTRFSPTSSARSAGTSCAPRAPSPSRTWRSWTRGSAAGMRSSRLGCSVLPKPIPPLRRRLASPNFPFLHLGPLHLLRGRGDGHRATLPSEAERMNALAVEASVSRMYGGIHYRFDCDEGLQHGPPDRSARLPVGETGRNSLEPIPPLDRQSYGAEGSDSVVAGCLAMPIRARSLCSASRV